VGQVAWLANLTAHVDYAALAVLIVGPLFGLGALGGDAIESFFKRQRNVEPGHGWFPFDQTDYIIGGALATAPFIRLELGQYVILIIFWLVVHIVASYIGYLLKLKERPI
jgi:CDP-diglyceride synthetase